MRPERKVLFTIFLVIITASACNKNGSGTDSLFSGLPTAPTSISDTIISSSSEQPVQASTRTEETSSSLTVAVTAPSSGTIVDIGSFIQLKAFAQSDTDKIARVEFYKKGNLFSTYVLVPTIQNKYANATVYWTVAPEDFGDQEFYAVAHDSLGNTSEPSESITVYVRDIEHPVVSITFPKDRATVPKGSQVIINVDASDNVGIAKVEFYINDNLECQAVVSPYVCTWSVHHGAKKKYNLRARAYDLAGNESLSHISYVTSE